MNEESIFIEALQFKSLADRASFLNEACNGKPDMRRDVESLLRAHQRAGRFLEQNPLEVMFAEENPISEGPGTLIGSYKLLELLGEGGFGMVFMADQEKPVRRRVALKIIKPGMDTRQVVARFEAERQALAMMEHSNIAQVFDGGETASGRPYFVMELVRGIPITDFSDQNQLPTHERLKLFASVCQAVQHAHQKGIIHRDLKPSNILVTLHNSIPVTKIIDFGIAKSTGPQLTNKTLFTSFAQMIGTPLYMSPEQVQMSDQDIDTRSDIYSLGVLLYELLTGRTPFDKALLQTASYDEIRRIIREDEPVKPSTHISTVAKVATTLSANRNDVSVQPGQLFRAELDWIVMKCLDKDRDRRYESAGSLAQDIERYLNDEPLQACPPSKWYRIKKFARRHRTELTISAMVLFFIVLLGGVIGWTVRDRTARQSYTTAAVQAAFDEARAFQKQSKWREGEAAARRAEALLAGGDGSKALQNNVQELLADLRICARFEEIRLLASGLKNGLFDSEREDRGYASTFHDYGIDVETLDPLAAAERIAARPIRVELTAALELWSKSRRRVQQNKGIRWQVLLSLANAVDTDFKRTRLRNAVIEGDRQAVVRHAASEELRTSSPGTLVLLAGYLEEMGALPEAKALLYRAREQHPDDFWINHQLAYYLASATPPQWDEAIRYFTVAVSLRPESPGARLNLATALSGKGQLTEAIVAVRRVIELQPDYAEAHNNLGIDLSNLGRLEEALASIRRALEFKPDLAEAHGNLGLVFEKQGRVAEAIAAYRRAINLQPALPVYHNGLGHALISSGQLQEAFVSIRKALELNPDYAEAHTNLGLALLTRGQHVEAIAECNRALKLKPDLVDAHLNLGLALSGMNRHDEALAMYRKAIILKPDYAEVHNNIGTSLLRLSRNEEALEAFREATRLKPELVRAHQNLGVALSRVSRLPESTAAYQRVVDLRPDDAIAHYDFGNALSDQGRYVEAEAAFRRSISLKPDFAESHCNLATVLQCQGEFKQALAEFKRGHELGSRRSNWSYPSEHWITECQRMCELEDRFPAFLRGETLPANTVEQTEFAQLCYYKKQHVAATRLWLSAFNADPKLMVKLEAGYRYQAACSAVLAASGIGVAANPVDDNTRLQWRKQALDWLKADLALNNKLLASDKQIERQQALQRLRHWQHDPDLAHLRDKTEIAKLPEVERVSCQQLWAELEAVVAKAEVTRGPQQVR